MPVSAGRAPACGGTRTDIGRLRAGALDVRRAARGAPRDAVGKDRGPRTTVRAAVGKDRCPRTTVPAAVGKDRAHEPLFGRRGKGSWPTNHCSGRLCGKGSWPTNHCSGGVARIVAHEPLFGRVWEKIVAHEPLFGRLVERIVAHEPLFERLWEKIVARRTTVRAAVLKGLLPANPCSSGCGKRSWSTNHCSGGLAH